MTRSLSILGSTGSIGRNVLDVVRQQPGRFKVTGLAAGRNIALLREQVLTWQPRLVAVNDGALAAELAAGLPGGWAAKIVVGNDGNERVATLADADMVVSAIVGSAGLLPTLAAIRAGKDVALANKETMVMAGSLVMDEVRRRKVRLLPIDSEHSAVAQALEAGRKEDVARIILTASGGPCRDLTAEKLWDVTPEQALAHPNWDMGRKISIDSATLMNKGLEVIEARWLFDVEIDRIDVLIHPQSIVHSLVEYVDGSVMAQLGVPDMRVPIAFALSCPERVAIGLPRLQLHECGNLHFFKPDLFRFPSLALAYHVCRMGGTMPAVMNAANEIAVDAFLNGTIRFPEIPRVVEETVKRVLRKEADDVETILASDREARAVSASIVSAAADRGAAAKQNNQA